MDAIREITHHLSRHERAVLHFSGGKDSLACLHLLRPWWDRVDVLWGNPGAALPETYRFMTAIRQMVPNFHVAFGEQPDWLAAHGIPVDVLPVRSGPGRSFVDVPGMRMQSFVDCCAHNLWAPMDRMTRALGATLVIRGQRDGDALKAPIRSGHVEDGITYCLPIQYWTDDDVMAYLRDVGAELPPTYAAGVKHSVDCWNCTAYGHQAERFAYLREKHPKDWQALRPLLREVKRVIEADSAYLNEGD